jgi:acyl-CoA synthetase (AMP-forming)/AMP-acid ligase II
MSQNNFADLWEQIADAYPDAPAQVHGDRRSTWKEFDRRADGIAKTLLDLGVERQDKVAQYLYNGPEYLESLYGTVKASLVPVNTNYRYSSDELVYLWDNADAVAVVFHGTFVEQISQIRSRVLRVRLWLWVDDGTAPCPDWATPYEDAANSATERVVPSWGRGGEDIYMLYTGGTTGMPKGVMWQMGDLIDVFAQNAGGPAAQWQLPGAPGPVATPACPLMHGTGAFVAFIALNLAGCIVTLQERKYDPVELLDTIEREKVNMIAIVGDAFAKPMLKALDDNEADGKTWDLSPLFMMISSGVMWSEETTQGLLRHHPALLLQVAVSSSEALGMGQSFSTGTGVSHTAKFVRGEITKVITEDGREVEPGSGEIGLLAVKGLVPVGYYKDPEKSERTFRVIDGARYSIPGDWATVEADGSLTVLGRGSGCINTGGEKVFPEEVEEALKTHPAVADTAVVGIPDEKWGEAITAVVVLREGETATDDELTKHVKSKLAAYKAPKHVVFSDTLGRSPAGKLDYPGLRSKAVAEVGA